jgi:hypothetical protein
MSEEESVEGIEPSTASEVRDAGPENQVAELQERVLRVQAELENFRKRSRREYEDAQRYRPEQGIHVEDGEVNNAAHRLVLQMGKVMADVLTSARSLLSSHKSISLCHRENGLRSEEPAPTSSPSLLQPSPPLKQANSFHQAP